jgi:hypothetical protein
VTPHDEYYAEIVHRCVAGMGTDEARLIRALVSRRSQLPGISSAYLRLHQKTLQSRVSEEFSGNVKVALNALLSGL